MKSINRLEDMVRSGHLTEMGRVIREKRIECKERLYDMSKKVGCSTSFLSSFELEAREQDKSWLCKIVKVVERENMIRNFT